MCSFSLQFRNQLNNKILNLPAVEIVNLLHDSRLSNDIKHPNYLCFLMPQTLSFRDGFERSLEKSCQSFQRCLDELFILNQFAFQSAFHYVQISGLFTVPSNVIKHFFYLFAAWHVFLLMRNYRGKQLRNHIVQVLGQVVLSVNGPVNDQVAGPDSVLYLDVPDLTV